MKDEARMSAQQRISRLSSSFNIRHSFVMRHASFVIVVAGFWLGGRALAEDQRSSTVGMPARIDELVLPGPELEARPVDDHKLPVVLRVVRVDPHGTAFRYSLVYYGLEPGEFELRDYLRRKDGGSTAELPPLRVTIRPVLAPGQVLPNAPQSRALPFLGGYRVALWVGAILWLLGLAVILFAGRGRRRRSGLGGAKPITLADRLRPLVEGAMAGTLTSGQRAELERMLLAYWRRRLGLETMSLPETFAVLRAHADAGPLLEHLEEWLHRPSPETSVDVTALLQPYRSVPAETAMP
jgi:hypothetical protein